MRKHLRHCGRLLRRQDGISLIMAVGILGVLSLAGTSAVYYSNTNQRSAVYSKENASAYDLAEAGINEIMAVLGHSQNNALNPTLLPETTRTYDAGSVTWKGTLNFATAVWSITSTGRIHNPTGATKEVTRVLRAEVPITPTYTQPLNNPAWDYIYATRTGNECDMELANNVLGSARLYVEGNFCLRQNAGITISAMTVKGHVLVENNAKIGLGTSMSTRVETYVGGQCKYAQGAWTTSGCSGNQDSRNIFAKRWDGTSWVVGVNGVPPVIARPQADMAEWYTRAIPGPTNDCTTTNGARSGSPPVFDNDAMRNNSVPGSFNLTPATSYTCRVGSPTSPAGELSWNATTRTLKILGTIFIDGSVQVAGGNLNQYNGQGTIYLSGTFYLDGKMCGGVANGNCDFPSWNPNTEMLMIVTAGSGGQAGTDTGILVNNNGQFQGGLFADYQIRFSNNAHAHGPLVGSTIVFVNNVTAYSFPTITNVPVGMPSNPEVYAQPNPPRLYSG
jgi:hypothetical protein